MHITNIFSPFRSESFQTIPGRKNVGIPAGPAGDMTAIFEAQPASGGLP
jgi:hypothetical protein